MKKIFAYLLAFSLIFILVGCGTDNSNSTTSANSNANSSQNNSGNTVDNNITSATADNVDLFKYCGIWEPLADDPKTMGGYWTTKYMEIDFTGTEITIHIPKSSYFCIKIDDNEYSNYVSEQGDYVIKTETGGKHTLRFYNNVANSNLYFGGASVPQGESLSRTPDRELYVQYVGDSITYCGKLHEYSEKNNWDYSIHAINGIPLCSRYNRFYPTSHPQLNAHFGNIRPGMETAYFRTSFTFADNVEIYGDYFDENCKLKYNFKTKNTPDVIYVFLGTNDTIDDTPEDIDFIDTYRDFVDKLIKMYGKNLKVVLMNSIYKNYTSNRHNNIDVAVKAISNDHPGQIYYIDIDTIASWNIKLGDGTHPSDEEYPRLAKFITEFIKGII